MYCHMFPTLTCVVWYCYTGWEASEDNEARQTDVCGDRTARGGQLWEPQPGREPGTGDMENVRESLINLVSIDRWKRLRHLNQKVRGRDTVL